MSEAYVNQVTLDCLLNKQIMNKYLKSQKNKSADKQERKFYKKRIFSLFKDIITGAEPSDLLPDVLYAYDNFTKSCIHYFKTIDNNDLHQEEYNEITNMIKTEHIETEHIETEHISTNFSKNEEADKMLMRSIKIDVPTLDKYVKRTSTKKQEQIILPKQKNIDLLNPDLKNKGLKKKNINNKYEEDNTKT